MDVNTCMHSMRHVLPTAPLCIICESALKLTPTANVSACAANSFMKRRRNRNTNPYAYCSRFAVIAKQIIAWQLIIVHCLRPAVQLCKVALPGHLVITMSASCGTVYCNRSCLFVGGSVTTITRKCVHRSSPNWVCR